MRRFLISSVAVLALCAAAPVAMAQTAAPATISPQAQSEDARLDAFFEQAFQARIALSPQQMTSLGIKTDYDKLDDVSDAAAARSLALQEAQLAQMKAEFDPAKLSAQSRMSWRLFEYGVQQARLSNQWRDWNFQFAANGNPTTSLPVFLINNHRISSVSDAEAYVSRITEAERYMGQVATTLKARAAEGVVSPRFVFAPSIENTRAVITGAPFDTGADNPVWADFQKKVAALEADQATKDRLLASARAALTGPYKQGFETVLTALAEVQPMADSDAGVWRLPNGEAYYNARLQLSTTTDLTADQIHQIGLDEVARIQREMEVIKTQVGFDGSLRDFFVFLKTDPRFQYPNTPEGKEQYLTDARGFIAQVMAVAPQWFSTLPKAALEVRAVEPFREATASIAFYNSPAPDGSRPGIYYVNLSDMTQVLKPQIEGISYHEGAPGHHFQIAYAQEIEGLPRFRRFGGYGAYAEGWGLYAEQLGKEMGFYQDPYSDFGRLSTELWRAVRLVTDTGLHAKRWSREQAMDYFRQNSLLSERDIGKEVERYITNPGQATSYKIGELKIEELRHKAEATLGDRFDIKDFHAVVLGSGSVPLDVLADQVNAWIAAGGGKPVA
ncbi:MULTISPECIES: DUF885 family protein [unclassified Brevundimonas]|uniref:DUF885 domain-containing protein n=1 Tax=unclassified Brevundimonas TaxID=2622653 RepID=UPI000CFC19DD|nr:MULTISPECIES: DUF885 domain-containing protein [unclassified Brevundimonas]PRA31131.1 DUF885 domain-containing protein [Brevundimonas sp. MYb27]PQZ81384.1 DUF885 domain-containing protein [Brevundimonas sp. MYb31]PRB12626.1 DUF885 domain-containing protein [Brevundimonas sp. MYb52]PRB33459.1 DUF885 domain-containing protein [Brevundimonas sp. MYb46]PRB51287.1 DUF885 domain-containing protein [Brevundimonas sp. MYb33]